MAGPKLHGLEFEAAGGGPVFTGVEIEANGGTPWLKGIAIEALPVSPWLKGFAVEMFPPQFGKVPEFEQANYGGKVKRFEGGVKTREFLQ